MTTRPSRILRRATGAALLTLTAAAAPAFASQSLVLDLADPANAAPTGALQSQPLVAGEAYVFVVAGTGSMWPATELTAPSAVCGAPEPSVIAPSPGRVNGPAGVDPQTMFGAPAGAVIGAGLACTPGALPRNSLNLFTAFEVSLGTPASWKRLAPVGGARTVPRTDHTYAYEVVGTGSPAAFRFIDMPSDDNYGRFGISILTAAECAKISCLGAPGGSGFQAGTKGDRGVVKSPVGNAAAGAVTLPTCAMTLPVRLKTRSGVKLKSASLKASGKTLASLKGSALRKSASLHRLPAKRFTLTVTAKTTSGASLKARASVSGCRKATKTPLSLNLR